MLGLRRSDLVMPAVIAVIAVAEVAAYDGEGKWAALALELAACVILVFRRTWTPVVATAAAVTVMGTWVSGPAMENLATGILIIVAASYALGRWVADLRGLIGMAVMLVVTLAAYVFVDERSHDVTDVVFVAAFLVPGFFMGRVVRRMADYNDLLAREQELVRREAVRDERDRI